MAGEGESGVDETQNTEQTEPEGIDTAQYLQDRAKMTGSEGAFSFDEQMKRSAAKVDKPPEDPAEGEAATEPTEPEGDAAPAKAGAEATEEATGEGQAEEAKPDGDGGTGTSPGDARGELPKGVKNRLDRQRRQTARRLSAKDAEIAALKAQIGNGETPPATPVGETPPSEPAPAAGADGESEGPYPAREDYESDKAWLDDIQNWEENKPLTKPTKEPPAAAPTPAPTDKPPPPQQNAVQQAYRERLADLEEAMDDWEQAPDGLADNFFEMLQAGKIKMPPSMLDFMSSDDRGAKLAAAFIEAPRQSRRIARMPQAAQVKAMENLLADSGKPPVSTEPKKTPSLPDMKPLAGQGDGPEKRLEDAEDTASYLSIRRGIKRRDPLGFQL